MGFRVVLLLMTVLGCTVALPEAAFISPCPHGLNLAVGATTPKSFVPEFCERNGRGVPTTNELKLRESTAVSLFGFGMREERPPSQPPAKVQRTVLLRPSGTLTIASTVFLLS